MPFKTAQRRDTLLIETMLSALDARESARGAGSQMLVYLADLLVQRAREEIESIHNGASSKGASSVDTSPTRNDGA